MSITILEGPDCAGKTSLAKVLATKNEVGSYHHFGPPPKRIRPGGPNPAFQQYLDFLKMLEQTRKIAGAATMPKTIIDRFIYGELIYGPIFRKDYSFEPWMLRMLERVLLAHQTCLIVCLPPWQVVHDTWQARKNQEMLKDPEQLHQVYNAYEQLANREFLGNFGMFPNVEVFQYDWTTKGHFTYDDIVSVINFARTPVNLGPGIGCFHKDAVVLVGDQVNTNVDTCGWPFVATTGSSRWLAEQLDKASIPERNLYWVNAKDREGNWTSPLFLERLNPRAVIALGATAKQWINKYKVKHAWTWVDHPSYHKRFHFRTEYPLIRELETLHATI